MSKKKPVMLIIMDGFGCSEYKENNAVAQANLKVLPQLWKTYPHSHLGASGEDVGLPDGRCWPHRVPILDKDYKRH